MDRDDLGKFVEQADSLGKPIGVRLKKNEEDSLKRLAADCNLRPSVTARILLLDLLKEEDKARGILKKYLNP
jgi:hypothetical protein